MQKSGKLAGFFQIKMANTPDFDAILNADTGLDKSSNDPQKSPEDKLSMIENSTISNLGPMQKMLRGTEVRGTTIGGSKFEESYLVDSIPFVMRTRIKNQIFDVLDKSGQDYAKVQVRGSDSFSKIEREIWTKKLGTTLDAIRRQKTTSGASLSVLEGLSRILEKSTETMRSQWEERAAESREYLDKRNIFHKISGLGRKRRFEKYSTKFLKNLEDKKAQVQASLNMVKLRKENDINDAKNKLQAKLAVHNNKDSSQRNALWKFVTASVEDPSIRSVDVNGTAINARSFGIKDHGDFLEALIALGYTTKADQLGKTEALSKDSKKTIDDFAGEETAFKGELNLQTNTNVTSSVTTALKACVSPAQEKVESLPKLVSALEATIRSKDPNFKNTIYGGSLSTPQQKLWKIMCHLNTQENNQNTGAWKIKHLNKGTLQNFLKYLKDVDKDTQLKSRVEDVDKKAEDYLNETVLKMHDLWNVTPKLSTFSKLSSGSYGAVQNKMTAFTEGTYNENFKAFERIKDNLSPEVKGQYERKWENISLFKEKIESLQKTWKEQEKRYKTFLALEGTQQNPLANNLSDQEALHNSVLANISSSTITDRNGATYQKANDAIKRIQEKWEYILEFGGDKKNGPETVDAKELKSFYESAEKEKTAACPSSGDSTARTTLQNALQSYKTINSATGDFDKRFRDELMEQYQKEQEDQLEETLKANTTRQWNVLNMSPEGEIIKLSYYDTLGTGTLSSAENLTGNQTPAIDLRIVKKTEKGIVLEEPGNTGRTFVLSGPTERKDGVWVPNVGVYNKKGAKIQPGSGVSGIMLGLNLNA